MKAFSYQEKKAIDSFLDAYLEECQSDSAKSLMATVQTDLKAIAARAKAARVLTLELLLVKALDNHQSSVEQGDATGTDSAIAVMKTQTDYLVKNNLLVTDADLLGPLLQRARTAMHSSLEAAAPKS